MLLDKYNGKIIDILLQGKFDNEDNVYEFLEHIFNEKKITNDYVYNIPYFKSEVKTSLLEQLFPLKTIPKNFNNHKNTFLDKTNKYFQINFTINVTNYTFLIDLNNFFYSFKDLIKNNDTSFLLSIRSYYNQIDTYLIKKNNVKEFNINEYEIIYSPDKYIDEYIKKQSTNFLSNFTTINL